MLLEAGDSVPCAGLPAANAVDTVEGGELVLAGTTSSGESELLSEFNVHCEFFRSQIVDVTPPSKVVTYGLSCRVMVTMS